MQFSQFVSGKPSKGWTRKSAGLIDLSKSSVNRPGDPPRRLHAKLAQPVGIATTKCSRPATQPDLMISARYPSIEMGNTEPLSALDSSTCSRGIALFLREQTANARSRFGVSWLDKRVGSPKPFSRSFARKANRTCRRGVF
jgi:hypothetical protein